MCYNYRSLTNVGDNKLNSFTHGTHLQAWPNACYRVTVNAWSVSHFLLPLITCTIFPNVVCTFCVCVLQTPPPNQRYVTVLQHVLRNATEPKVSSKSTTSSRNFIHRRRNIFELWLSKYKERSKRIDVVARMVFPVGFFLFNCIYWIFYLT